VEGLLEQQRERQGRVVVSVEGLHAGHARGAQRGLEGRRVVDAEGDVRRILFLVLVVVLVLVLAGAGALARDALRLVRGWGAARTERRQHDDPRQARDRGRWILHAESIRTGCANACECIRKRAVLV
ncbi:MAG: hypothetical protein ACK55I_02945, partial [bacterium]